MHTRRKNQVGRHEAIRCGTYLRTSVGRVTNGVFDGSCAVLGKVTLLKGVKDVGRGTEKRNVNC